MASDRDRFPTLKEEARGNVERIDPVGVELQGHTLRLFVRPGLEHLEAVGEPDTRCGTCAFRPGTVPGSCIQTQADALKAICEDVPFYCHAHTDANGKFDTVCHGWYAARSLMEGQKILAPWPWVSELTADPGEQRG